MFSNSCCYCEGVTTSPSTPPPDSHPHPHPLIHTLTLTLPSPTPSLLNVCHSPAFLFNSSLQEDCLMMFTPHPHATLKSLYPDNEVGFTIIHSRSYSVFIKVRVESENNQTRSQSYKTKYEFVHLV